MTSARILVVDDEPDLEQLISQKFRREIRRGTYSFLFAHDGEEALKVLDSEPDVDIVLSDINMPRMDGLTLLRHLQEFDDHLRSVIVSAYGDMVNIRTAMNLGAFDFVTKPIEFDDLEITINKTLKDLHKMREVQRQREAAEQAKATLLHYFSPAVAEHLVENPDALALRGERREVSFVFSDLADFTPLVESREPAELVPLLNDYLDGMTQVVFRHAGTVEKIVGDAVHAMFGAPLDQPDHAERSVACAMELDEFAEGFRARKRDEGIPLGVTRIGVHTGQVVVGNFGGPAFFNYTAYGDAINTAARLEGANKYLGTRVCVSADVVKQIPGFRGRPIGTIVLQGKTKQVRVFEPLPVERMDSSATRAYCEAFAKLESGDPTASQAFAAVVGEYGEDSLATFHLKRLLAGATGDHIELAGK